MDAPPGVDGLGLLICYFYLLNTKSQEHLVDFHQTWYRSPPPGEDELIRF